MKNLLGLLVCWTAIVAVLGCGNHKNNPAAANADEAVGRSGSASVMASENNSSVQISGPSVYDFGTVTNTASSGQVQFAIQNLGANTVNLYPAEISVPMGFKIDTKRGCYGKPVLQAYSSCTVNVAFSPMEEGNYSGVLAVNYMGGRATRPIRGFAIAKNQNNPGTPTITSALSSTGGTAHITFQADSRNTSRYLLYYSTDGVIYGPLTIPAEERSGWLTQLQQGTTYQFQVVAVSPMENKTYSNQPSVQIQTAPLINAAPVHIASIQQAPRGILYVTWEPLANVSNLEYFEVYAGRSNTPLIVDRSAVGIPIAGLPSGRTSISVVSVSRTGVRAGYVGLNYDYYHSSPAPAAPVLTAGPGTRNGTVQLSWTNIGVNVDHFKVYYSYNGDLFGPIHRPASDRSYVVSGLPDGAQVAFQIVAESEEGVKSYSNQPTATTAAPAIAATGLKLTNGTSVLSSVFIQRTVAGDTVIDYTLQNFGPQKIANLQVSLSLPFANFYKGYIAAGGSNNFGAAVSYGTVEKNSSRVLRVKYSQVGNAPYTLSGYLYVYDGNQLLTTIPVVLQTL